MAAPPPRRWPRSIRDYLLVLVAALGIPLLGFQIWASSHATSRALDAAGREASAKSEAVAAHLGQYLVFAQLMLERAPLQQATAARASGVCAGSAFERREDRLFETLTVVTTDSEIVCSSRPVPDSARTGGWALVEETVEAGAFRVGNVVPGRITGGPVLPLGTPIRGADGTIEGVLTASIRVADSPIVADIDLEPGEVVTVASSDGHIIARWPDLVPPSGDLIGRQFGPDNQVGQDGSISRAPGTDGVDRIWARVQTEHGWFVEVGLPAEAMLGAELASARRNLAGVLLVLLLAVGLTGLSYRRIRAGLDELADRIRAEPGTPLPPASANTPSEVADVISYLDDVTRSRDEAVEGERKAVDRYHALFENVVFGVGRTTRDGRFLEANSALAKILGYDSAEALIEAGPLAVHRSPEARNEAIDAAGDGVFRHLDEELIRADGTSVHVRIDGRVLTDENGDRIIEGIVQDISEQKMAEARLRQSQKMEAVGQLAGGIAHDFNNLLTAIGGSMEVIEERLGEASPVSADVDRVRGAVDRASSLTRQLLAFAGREQREAGVIDVNQVLVDSERLLKRLIGEEIILSTRIGPGQSPVAIEADQLSQVVMNLVLNSRDAMPDGGRITISTDARVVDGREGVVLTIADVGMGMHAETQKRIFEPFFSTKSTGEGTGLGMSIVYGIVHRADGRIDIESAPFRGTTVEVWLPAGPSEDIPTPTPPVTESADGGNEHILVVEDDNNVRLFVQRALVEAGYSVTAERDGADALDRVRSLERPCDLVLTDVVMPRKSGIDLGRDLKSFWPTTPVLYMTGFTSEHELRAATDGNPRLLLRKPFRAHELRARVREVLDQFAATSG